MLLGNNKKYHNTHKFNFQYLRRLKKNDKHKMNNKILENSNRKYKLLFFVLFNFLIVKSPVLSQTAWFADGYHGGVYGHYPIWQAKFMVDQLKKNPDWALNLEIEPETWDTISIKDPENFKSFQSYYDIEGRSGRIDFVNPTWAQPYCYNISGESIIRQFAHGLAKTKEYFTHAFFHTYSVEEPCFTSSLPQILKGFGFKYAVLRNPNTCWGGYTSAFGKDLVNWIGPDGTSIPAVPRYAIEDLSEESTWQTESWMNSNSFIEKCFANGIKYPVGMCFQDAGWNGGPWKSEYQPTTYITWTNYIEKIKNKVEPDDWRFSQEDIMPGLVWGAQVIQKIAQQVRVSENRLIMSEKLSALDYLFNDTSWPETDFAEAWRTLMLAQHHDCWIVPYNGKPGDTWANKVTRWTSSSNRIANEKIFHLFGEAVDSKYIRVYNTLGTTRKDMVTLLLPNDLSGREITVFDSSGKIVSSQVSENSEGKSILHFIASVSGMGYASYKIKDSAGKKANKLKEEDHSKKLVKIETDFYSVLFDSSKGGAITSLVDKKNGGKELVQRGRLLNNLKGFFYEEGRFYEGSENRSKISIIEEGSLFIKVKIENNIAGNSYYQLITFNKYNPRIDFALHIDWEGQPGIGAYDNSHNFRAEDRKKVFYNDKYKLHLEFPFNEIGDKLFKNASFDVCESELENTIYSSWDSIKHNVILNWVDLTNQVKDRGVALFSDHTTSYIQHEDLPLGLTVQYVGKALWGINYKIHVPTDIKYAIYPHTGDWEKGMVQKSNNEWNEPLIAKFITDSSSYSERNLIEILDDNLEISSVIVDDDALIVRFFNASSANKPQRILLNCNVEIIEQIDLNGNTISVVTFQKTPNGQLSMEIMMPQFGFQTFKMKGIKII